MNDDECTCEHVLDEHDRHTLACEIEDCDCVYFEDAEGEEL